MADSLTSLSPFEVFPLEPNWARSPAPGLIYARHLEVYAGTSAGLDSITDFTPFTVRSGFSLERSENYDLVDFFVNRRGRWGKYWLKSLRSAFTLRVDMPSGSTILSVYDNGAYEAFEGHERIYIEMMDGDLITRHVINVLEVAEGLSLVLDVQLDRDVTLTNHWIIGRLMLGRFDIDKISFKHKSDAVSEAQLRFIELPTEYVEAS